jgi:hypothetical protein
VVVGVDALVIVVDHGPRRVHGEVGATEFQVVIAVDQEEDAADGAEADVILARGAGRADQSHLRVGDVAEDEVAEMCVEVDDTRENRSDTAGIGRMCVATARATVGPRSEKRRERPSR